jgi:hypothetical protein
LLGRRSLSSEIGPLVSSSFQLAEGHRLSARILQSRGGRGFIA